MGAGSSGGDGQRADPRWYDIASWNAMASALATSSASADRACLAFLGRTNALYAVDGG